MSIISITDKGKTITYHAHHMRDVIEPVKQYGMFGEQLNAKKKLHTLTFYTEDYLQVIASRPPTSRISSLLDTLTRTNPSTVRS